MLGRRGAALAVHPTGIAVPVVLFFPDRHAMLHFIDDEAAGIECLAAMGGADADPYRHIAQRQCADAVNAQRALDGISPQGFGDDTIALGHGEFLKGLVLQARDFLPFIVIAHPAFEGRVASRTQIEQFPPRLGGVDGIVGESKAHQPPATGGRNTTASPAASLRDQSANSLLTATFNCSLPKVNPCRAINSAYRSAGVRAVVSRVSSDRPACSRISAKYRMFTCMGSQRYAPSSVCRACAYSSGVFTLSSACWSIGSRSRAP